MNSWCKTYHYILPSEISEQLEPAAPSIYKKGTVYCTISTKCSRFWEIFHAEMAEIFSFDLRRIKKTEKDMI